MGDMGARLCWKEAKVILVPTPPFYGPSWLRVTMAAARKFLFLSLFLLVYPGSYLLLLLNSVSLGFPGRGGYSAMRTQKRQGHEGTFDACF